MWTDSPAKKSRYSRPSESHEPRALPAHELDRRAGVGVHRVAALEGLQLLDAHGVTMVPMPASVNSSSSSECGRRPSMMWADPTPPRTASTQAPSFGRMPPATELERGLDLAHRDPRVQRGLVVGIGEPAGDVGEEDRLERAERGRDLARRRVGVDVVGAALAVDPGRGDHRDVVGGDVVEDVDVDALDLAYEADLLGARVGLDLEQRPVLAREPDRRLAVAVEPHDDVGVDLAEQHHLRDLDRLGVGDAHALDEPHLHPEPLHVAGDVRARPRGRSPASGRRT